ncbi:MAG: hypothetical protein ACPG19_08605 [Saprospiraceae bacterium]
MNVQLEQIVRSKRKGWVEVPCPRYRSVELANAIREQLEYLGYEVGTENEEATNFVEAFDKITENSLLLFQKDYNLPQCLDMKTLAKLKIS